MPRPNASGSSAGRRGASRSNSGGRSSGGNRSSGKPFKKSSDGEEKRGGYAGKRPSSGAGKPFKKTGKSFGKRDDDSTGSPKRRSSSERPSGRSGDTSSRPDKRFDKPYRSKRDDSGSSERSYPKRSASSERYPRKESTGRPYKKSDRPFGKRRDEDSSDKRYGKRDDSGSSERSYPKRSSSSERYPRKESTDRPFKKFDKPFDKRKEGSSDKPFKKSDRENKRPFSKRKDEDAVDKKRFFNKDKNFSADRERPARRPSEELKAPAQTEKIRLNKYIANSGVCSRREADELITMGLISVNGKTITELGYKVNPGDEVRYETRVLTAEKPVYILMNKPKGYLTTTDDPQERNTVMQLLGNAVKERIYPVGRLDRNTTGLLLLTNDGDLAEKLMHPSYNIKKIYKVELDRPLAKADYQAILDGVRLEEGKAMVDDLAIVSDDGKTVGIELHIGWNRVVRRIFETLNYEVIRLDRSVYAGLDKKDLARGHWRFLTREEIVRLKHYQ